MKNTPAISIKRARQILGTEYKDISDKTILKIIGQIEVITDVVIARIIDSKLKSGIEIEDKKAHSNKL